MISLFAFDRATTSPYAGDSIDSTRPARSPYEVDDRDSPKCAATSSSAVLLATHKKRDQRWGVPDEPWVKEAVQRLIHMSSSQQKACAKCGLHPAAGNQLRRCGSCLAVKYCSSACQTDDWASHRLVCKNVGAARHQELMPLMLAIKGGRRCDFFLPRSTNAYDTAVHGRQGRTCSSHSSSFEGGCQDKQNIGS